MIVGYLTEQIFAKAKARPYTDGSGKFFIRMGWPIGLRYYEGIRAITIFFDLQSRARSWSRFLPGFLRSLSYQTTLKVYMDIPLVWDNTEEQPNTPDAVIQQRVEDALRVFGAPYRLIRTHQSTL